MALIIADRLDPYAMQQANALPPKHSPTQEQDLLATLAKQRILTTIKHLLPYEKGDRTE